MVREGVWDDDLRIDGFNEIHSGAWFVFHNALGALEKL